MLKSFADGHLFGGAWGPGTPTILALHGWQRDHHDFARLFDELVDGGDDGGGERSMGAKTWDFGTWDARSWGAVAPDLFGFGATPPPPEPWGTEQYARQLMPLFDEPGLLADRIVLVGHSFGGRVAVQLQRLVPDRIERLVLTSVPLIDRAGRRTRPPIGYRVVRQLHRAGLLGEARLEVARRRYGSADYRAAEGVMRGVLVKTLAERYAEKLANIGCPVQLVWGEDDTEVPLEVAVRAQPLFPSATLVTLPGVGHLTPTEAPEALGEVIMGRSGPAREQPRGSAPAREQPRGSVVADPTRGAP
ncbi:MAG: alpha/beta fold hydrolase [Acidimicrobiales bacterium]